MDPFPNTHTLHLVRKKGCKHSVRYTYDGPDSSPAIRDVYVSRTAWASMPSVIEITIAPSTLTPAEAGAKP